ncbi:MAG: hypothetical protein FJX74_20140 [Armatimonadetes bacterium]|nr:hypothetical protein [Armatimonadota bacterium]
MPIESITIQGIRGIREPVTLAVEGRSLLLHGPNGSGKSSVERALRWVLMNEEVPTDEEPFTTESSYRRHVGVPPDYPSVEVVFQGGARIAVSREAEAFEGGAEAIRAACQRGAPFLRRRELLDVLSARPSDRFRYFETFLGLDPVDTSIRGVAEQRASLERRANGLRERLAQQVGALRPLLPGERQALAHDLASLEAQAIAAAIDIGIAPIDSGWEAASAGVMALAGERTEEDLIARRARLQECEADLARVLDSLAAPPRDPTDAESLRRELEKASALTGQLDIIQHALRHFQSAEGTTCPVCGQGVDWNATRERLAAQSRTLVEYSAAIQERDEAVRRWLAVWRDFRAAQSRLEAILGGGEAGLGALAALGDPIVHLDRQEDRSTAQAAAMLDLGGAVLRQYLQAATNVARARAAAAAAQVPAVAQLPGLRLIVSLFERLGGRRVELLMLASELGALTEQIAFLEVVHEALRHARQDVARETLAAISQRVSEYYGVIHPPGSPDESTGAPEIVVQRHGGGTAFVRGQFADQGVRDPQWVYSDGHLDTVGICIFLALRRFRADQGGDPRLLILDDIIVSIDLGHARRLIDLLKGQFHDHQVFLFTHNGLFAHWCADLMPGLRRLEIKAWTLDTGPRLGEYVQSRERLLECLDDASPKEIGLKLMWLMDEWLAEARYAYAVSVPARPDERYTLSDIWNPFAKIVRRLATTMDSELGGATAAVEQLSDLPSIRNTLPAHENEFAREFPRNVMVEVARAAVALVDGLYCLSCRTFARPVPDRANPEVVVCRCRHLQYVRPGGAGVGGRPPEGT